VFFSLTQFLGSLLIGFGLGIALSRSLAFSTFQYLGALILSLVLGGFLLAWSWKGKKKSKDDEGKGIEEKEEIF
jgi:protein-S-isoprenylcysteine O-methyltransferase Ste14